MFRKQFKVNLKLTTTSSSAGQQCSNTRKHTHLLLSSRSSLTVYQNELLEKIASEYDHPSAIGLWPAIYHVLCLQRNHSDQVDKHWAMKSRVWNFTMYHAKISRAWTHPALLRRACPSLSRGPSLYDAQRCKTRLGRFIMFTFEIVAGRRFLHCLLRSIAIRDVFISLQYSPLFTWVSSKSSNFCQWRAWCWYCI